MNDSRQPLFFLLHIHTSLFSLLQKHFCSVLASEMWPCYCFCGQVKERREEGHVTHSFLVDQGHDLSFLHLIARLSDSLLIVRSYFDLV